MLLYFRIIYFSTKKVVNRITLARRSKIGNPELNIMAIKTIAKILAYFPTIPNIGPVRYLFASLCIIALFALIYLRLFIHGVIKKLISYGLNVKIMNVMIYLVPTLL